MRRNKIVINVLLLAAMLVLLGTWPLLGRRILVLCVSIGSLATLISGAYGVGSVLLKLLSRNPSSSKDVSLPATWSLLCGLGVYATVVYALASLGMYHKFLGFTLLIFGILLGRRAIVALICNLEIPYLQWEISPVILALGLSVGVPVVFWDTLAYHFAIPEYINATGSLIAEKAYVFGFYALAMESLYALALAMPFGEVVAQLLNVALMITACNAAVLTLTSEKRRLGLALLYSTPALLMLAFVPKNYGLLALAGVVSVDAALGRESSSAEPEERAVPAEPLMAGAALGIALFTHHGALCLVPFIAWLVAKRSGIRSAAASLAVALPFVFPLYLRNYITAGNPTYPFLSSVFGGIPLAPPVSGAVSSRIPWLNRFQDFFELWSEIEPSGIGSTFLIAVPLGLLFAWLYRREERIASYQIRLMIGLIILAAGTVIFARPRYGIIGFFLLIPMATVGLSRAGRSVGILLLIQSLIGAVLLIGGPLRPLDTFDASREVIYRKTFCPTFSLASFAQKNFPAGTKIVSVGILRSYGWGGMLEPVSVKYQPPFLAVLETAATGEEAAQFLKAQGFDYFAVDFLELNRLQRQYGYLQMTSKETRVFQELIDESSTMISTNNSALFQIGK